MGQLPTFAEITEAIQEAIARSSFLTPEEYELGKMEGYAFCGEEAVALFQEFAEKTMRRTSKKNCRGDRGGGQEAEPKEGPALIEESTREDMEPSRGSAGRARGFLLSRGLDTSGRRQQDTVPV